MHRGRNPVPGAGVAALAGNRAAWGLALLYLVAALRLAMDGGATSLIAAGALVAVAVVVVAIAVRSGARGRAAWLERNPDPARRRG